MNVIVGDEVSMRAFVWYVRVFVVVLLLLSSAQTIVAADHQTQHGIAKATLAQQPAITSTELLIALIYGLSLLAIFACWRLHRSSSPPLQSNTLILPDTLPPALVARLTGAPKGYALLGTLFDLANRGHVRLNMEPHGFVATRLMASQDPLAAFESAALDVVFDDNQSVNLSERRYAIMNALGSLDKLYDKALIADGYLAKTAIKWRTCSSTMIFIVSAPFTCLLMPGMWILLPEFDSLDVGGLVLAWVGWNCFMKIISSSVERLTMTSSGKAVVAYWKAWKATLVSMKPGAAQSISFLECLPYAVAMSQVQHLEPAYPAEPIPVWYERHATAKPSHAARVLSNFSYTFISMLEPDPSPSGSSLG